MQVCGKSLSFLAMTMAWPKCKWVTQPARLGSLAKLISKSKAKVKAQAKDIVMDLARLWLFDFLVKLAPGHGHGHA